MRTLFALLLCPSLLCAQGTTPDNKFGDADPPSATYWGLVSSTEWCSAQLEGSGDSLGFKFPGFYQALVAAGFGKDSGYVYNFFYFPGNYKVGTYAMCASHYPPFTQGAMTYLGENTAFGGLEFGVKYVPGDWDPTAGYTKWLRLVRTNSYRFASARGGYWRDPVNGDYFVIDSLPTGGHSGSPFLEYNNGYRANGSDMMTVNQCYCAAGTGYYFQYFTLVGYYSTDPWGQNPTNYMTKYINFAQNGLIYGCYVTGP